MANGDLTILATPYSLFAIRYSLFAIPCRIRRPDEMPGTGRGVRERRLGAALKRRASPALPHGVLGLPLHAFSALQGRSGPSAGGVATGTPGTIGTASRRAFKPGRPRPARAPFPPHVIQAVQTTPPRGKEWGKYKGAWEGVDEKVGNFFRGAINILTSHRKMALRASKMSGRTSSTAPDFAAAPSGLRLLT
jgi:hypothetical protein